MVEPDKTTMGGESESFHTTCWSDIQDAQRSIESDKKDIIGKLLTRYWKPVYCYLRRKGYNNEHAKDLTQGFFHEIVLGRNLIQEAEETRGRFRTFLLTALDRYVANVYRQETSKKRTPMGRMVTLEAPELLNLPSAQALEEPSQIFHYTWATNLLDEVLTKVENEFCRTGKVTHWEIFREKVLAPLLYHTELPSLDEICAKYGVEGASKASNMIVTVKRRFRSVLRRSLRQLVHSDSEVEEEYADLLKILSKNRAR